MTPETARLLTEAAHELNLSAEPQPSYSGRGMFGRTTEAIAIDNIKDLITMAAKAGAKLGDTPALTDFLSDLNRIRTDTIGYGHVAY